MQRISVTRNSGIWGQGNSLGEPGDPVGRYRSGSVGGTPLLNIPESKIASSGHGSPSNLWDFHMWADSMQSNLEIENLELSESHAYFQPEASQQATPSENPRRLSFETRKLGTLGGSRINYVPSFYPRAKLPGTPSTSGMLKKRISTRQLGVAGKNLMTHTLTIGEQTPSQKWAGIQNAATKSQTLGADVSLSHETARNKLGWTQKITSQASIGEQVPVATQFTEHTAPMSRFATDIKKTETLVAGRSRMNVAEKRCLFIQPQQPGGDSTSGIQAASSIRNVKIPMLKASTELRGTNDTLKSLMKELGGPTAAPQRHPPTKPPTFKTDGSKSIQESTNSRFAKKGVQIISVKRPGIQKVIAYESSSESNASSRQSRQSRESMSPQKSNFNKGRPNSRFRGDYRTGD